MIRFLTVTERMVRGRNRYGFGSRWSMRRSFSPVLRDPICSDAVKRSFPSPLLDERRNLRKGGNLAKSSQLLSGC